MPEAEGGSHGADFACEDEAREALATAGARLWPSAGLGDRSGACGPATLSLRWRRSGAEGFLGMSRSSWEPAPQADRVGWMMLAERADDGQFDEVAPIAAGSATDWRLHRELYRHRSDIGAVVCSRPVFSTTLACIPAGRDGGLPAFHPDVVRAAGGAIRCAAQAAPASAARSRHVLEALEDRNACLLAAEGLLATGPTLPAAIGLSRELESLAQVFCLVLQLSGERGR